MSGYTTIARAGRPTWLPQPPQKYDKVRSLSLLVLQTSRSSVSNMLRGGYRTRISDLPDEILHRILSRIIDEECPPIGRLDDRLTIIPLVCKKWGEVLYLQGAHLQSQSPALTSWMAQDHRLWRRENNQLLCTLCQWGHRSPLTWGH